jgi:triosephosphate isomerase
MYKTIGQAIELANGITRDIYSLPSAEIDIVICPPFTALSDLSEIIQESAISLGAQDVYWKDEGAFTGEISPLMLKDLGCQYVIIGHSERRQYFHETNETVNQKLHAALLHGLSPIMCVGETLQERERKETFTVLKDHVSNGLKGMSEEAVRKTVIAYEPVWAIGTGKTATTEQAQEAHQYIRSLLENLYGQETSTLVRILYGGSVKPDNVADLIKQPDIDGALVGGASLVIDSFVTIIKKASEVKK